MVYKRKTFYFEIKQNLFFHIKILGLVSTSTLMSVLDFNTSKLLKDIKQKCFFYNSKEVHLVDYKKKKTRVQSVRVGA